MTRRHSGAGVLLDTPSIEIGLGTRHQAFTEQKFICPTMNVYKWSPWDIVHKKIWFSDKIYECIGFFNLNHG